MNPILIAPSILAADFSRIADEVRSVEAGGADWLHLDVMDGHFVDNLSFGPAMVEAVRKVTSLPLDVHLMIERPDHYFPRFVDAGADSISVHLEARHDVESTLSAIRKAGCRAGLAINPPTPITGVVPYFGQMDQLLVMTVHPGFGGQAFIAGCLEKVEAAGQAGWTGPIEVDGGIDAETAREAGQAGATVFVAGTSVFGRSDKDEAIDELRRAATPS